jgi:hypothetical protein
MVLGHSDSFDYRPRHPGASSVFGANTGFSTLARQTGTEKLPELGDPTSQRPANPCLGPLTGRFFPLPPGC